MIFPKLFNVGENDQILFTKECNDEEEMDQIDMIVRIAPGVEMKQRLSFTENGERDKAFDEIDQQKAETFLNSIREFFFDFIDKPGKEEGK